MFAKTHGIDSLFQSTWVLAGCVDVVLSHDSWG